MALYITALNSGSNGNCYYVGNDTEAILIDAGISCLEIEKRMQRLGLSMGKLKAVFVSHEHTDHTSGLQVLSKKYRLPVYITSLTLRHSGLRIEPNLVKNFSGPDAVMVGEFSVIPFAKQHDAADPYSFIVCCDKITIGIFTDIGRACNNVISHFSQCHAAFLEANYDEDMLEKGRYPYFLKTRIRGGNGHLSNKEALALFTSHRPSFMSHLLLSHISKNNNCPDKVARLFDQPGCDVQMVLASRYKETDVYRIDGSTCNNLPATHRAGRAAQLSLVFD
jgi:phosphoribosyl 1,2-cyclic phosphodiesterase